MLGCSYVQFVTSAHGLRALMYQHVHLDGDGFKAISVSAHVSDPKKPVSLKTKLILPGKFVMY